ncbi:MAG: hypothetical protein ACRCWF_08700 [Beijerinckiaceae bacterium]
MQAPFEPSFSTDSDLGYLRSRTAFLPGKQLILDESYRLAHLPLVNSVHPDVISSVPGKDYIMGQHGPVHSLVLPIPPEKLEASTIYQALVAEMKSASFAHKIAWDTVTKRRAKLHATLCGSLGRDTQAPLLPSETQDKLSNLMPFDVELRGLFSGNINVGRLYLKAYPARRNESQAFHEVQHIMGRPLTDLYVVGLFNLTDHLTAEEARDLAALIERWWDKPIFRFQAQELWLLTAHDDLVLDANVAQRIRSNDAAI